MKNNPLALMLIAILLISALGNSWLAFSYNASIKKLRSAQRDPDVLKVQNNRAGLQVLVADLVEYSKTHPAINPLLQTIGVATPGGAARPAAPAKPGGK